MNELELARQHLRAAHQAFIDKKPDAWQNYLTACGIYNKALKESKA